MTPPNPADDCSGTHSRPGHSTPKLWKAIGALDNAPLFNIPYLLEADMSDIVHIRGNKKPESCSITGTPLNNSPAHLRRKANAADVMTQFLENYDVDVRALWISALLKFGCKMRSSYQSGASPGRL